MTLDDKITQRKSSKKRERRFYTALDMAIVKKDIAIRNAKIKRGEIPNHPNHYIYLCGCGAEGCFLHGSHENY
jgi:hypothetical protein